VDGYIFFARKYREDNIIAIVVHLDETNPHVHLTLLPVTSENKISWKQVFVGKDKYELQQRMKQLHDGFAVVNGKYGLERGDAVEHTGARHRTTEEYRDWLDESAKILGKRLTRKKTLYELNSEISKAERRLKGLTTMLSNLEQRKMEIENELAGLEAQRQQGLLTNDELARRKGILRNELDSILEKIKERQQQLQTARQQLQDVADRKDDMETEYKELPQKVKEDMPVVHDKALRDMKSTAWQVVAEDAIDRMEAISEYSKNLPPEEKKIIDNMYENVFDGSVFESMSENAGEIATVATALFLGYLDQATDFAKGHGGGGGSGKGWGRSMDDDDEAWRCKCFFMGMKMMKPAGRKLNR
jgi:predicted  nucleic acid-binding Zn-ribbon protein